MIDWDINLDNIKNFKIYQMQNLTKLKNGYKIVLNDSIV